MLGSYAEVGKNSNEVASFQKGRLIGYVLTTRHYDPGQPAIERLAQLCQRTGYKMCATEWDVAASNNPMRLGLWRALRQLMCDRCEPIRMSYSMINFDDFMNQVLTPCHCGNRIGLDGIVVKDITQICTVPQKGTKFVIYLANANKHVITEDGICISCCHPTMRSLLNKLSGEEPQIKWPTQFNA